jgi:hypothetical protein
VSCCADAWLVGLVDVLLGVEVLFSLTNASLGAVEELLRDVEVRCCPVEARFSGFDLNS